MKDRFDLEDEILFLSSFIQHLETLSENIIENDLSTDQTVNALEGIKVMLQLHSNKLFDTMTQCFKLDQYNNNYVQV